jgi:hypothetical protein
MPDKSDTAPHELYRRAGGDPDKYRALMIEYGHLVPRKAVHDHCRTCGVSKQSVLGRDAELISLVKRAGPFVNAVAVMAEDKRPPLSWLADAAAALRIEQYDLIRESEAASNGTQPAPASERIEGPDA